MSRGLYDNSRGILTRDMKGGTLRSRDGIVVSMPMSALGTFLREKIRESGHTQTEFAAELGIQKSTMSRIVNGVVETPDLTTLMQLSDGTGASLSQLLGLIGISVEKTIPGDVAASERLGLLVDSIPWLAPIVEQIASLPEDDQNSVLSYIEFLRRKNQGNQGQTT
jgi:transcriptional regulator with XRE-family HTH domain